MIMRTNKGATITDKMKKLIVIALTAVMMAAAWAWHVTGERFYITVLNYHRIDNAGNPMTVPPADFEQQLRYLRDQGYTSVTLDEVAAYLAGKGELPARPVVITFDDGYEDNQRVAVPLLRKYGFHGIIFVITDNIGKPGYLTWEQMKAVQERAINIGSHTMTHADLTKLDAAELARELQNSKASLEKGLGTRVDYIAYPYGGVNAQVIAATKDAGYKGGSGTSIGVVLPGDNMYNLRRIYISPSLFGLWDFKFRLQRARLLSVFQ